MAEKIFEGVELLERVFHAGDYFLMGAFLLFVGQKLIGLVDFDKLFLSLYAVPRIFGVIFESLSAISFFDFFKGGVFGDAKGAVIVSFDFYLFLGADFGEELFFVLVDVVVVFKEFIESGLGVIERVPLLEDLVVVRAIASVVEDVEGLIYFIELLLGNLFVVFIEFWVPLVDQFFISLLYLEGGGCPRDVEDFVVVFELCSGGGCGGLHALFK